MSKTRFTPWVVLACIATLAGCTSGEDGTVGNTELNVVIPSSDGSGFDIEVVEYTINCDATPPTAADFPGIDSIEPTFDPDVTINGALEVLDTASSGVTTQDFGPDLSEVYVWQDFMDIPLEAICTVQLRARDAGGEVICTATEPFDTNTVPVGGVVKVNVLMYCGVSFQAPVASLDVDGDFSFNIANFCPDLFVLNCVDPDLEELLVVPGLGAFVYSGCQVRFRDGDSQCGDSCDPQTCVTDTEGLTCTAADGNRRCLDDLTIQCANNGDCTDAGAAGPCGPVGVSTVVSCASDAAPFACAIPGPLFRTPCTPVEGDLCFDLSGGLACAPTSLMNCGGASADPNCQYRGDTLGVVGGAPPGPLNVGEGGFLVGCTMADDDGDPRTPPVALSPGATVTCTADTTDGDEDCDKQKTTEVFCPGDTPCQAFGGNAACQAASSTVCQVGTCNPGTCDGATAAACCDYVDAANGVDCSAEQPPLASCQAGVCVSDSCTDDASCETSDECTFAGPGICDVGTGICGPLSDEPAGTSCDAGNGFNSGKCDGVGTCVDICTGVTCDDGIQCTTDPPCDSSTGSNACPPPVNDDTNTCDTCGGSSCVCSGGSCIAGCTVPPPADTIGIPMACRNSFDIKAVSTFPIDLLNVTPDGCILDGQPVNFGMDPVIALDVAFLQAAADTLCDLGTALTEADVSVAQIAVDAVAGATCTEQLTELTPVPQLVKLDATVTGTCGSGGTVTINSGTQLPLPRLTLPCTAGTAGSNLTICSVGTVPLAANIDLSTAPVQTFVGVAVGGGTIQVVFQCNTSSTTVPAPGTDVECTAPNPDGACAAIPAGNVGEQPFPVSDCDFSSGFPGTCTTVPVGVDPLTVCPTFTVGK